MRKTFKVFVASTAVIAGALVSSPAAQATGSNPIASDSSFRLVSCSADVNTNVTPHPVWNTGLLNLDKTTLEGTLIDANQDACDPYYVASAAFNPEDSKIYVTQYNDNDAYINLFDATTGVRSGPYHYTLNGDDYLHSILLAIDPATGIGYAYEVGENKGLFSVDLTADPSAGYPLTPIKTQLTQSGNSSVNLLQLAFNPDGNLIAWENAVGQLVKINTSTGAITPIPNTDYNNLNTGYNFGSMNGMAFDSRGTLFFQANANRGNDNNSPEIWYASASDHYTTVHGVPGANPYAGDTSYQLGSYITANSPWTNPLNGSNVQSGSIPDIGAPLVITYGRMKVVYNGNHGTASRKSDRFLDRDFLTQSNGLYSNAPITLPGATRSGYTFNGWFDAATGGNLIGKKDDTYTPDSNENVNLYAQWTKDGGSSSASAKKKFVYFNPGSSVLTSDAKKALAKIAKKYKTGYSIEVKGYAQAGGSHGDLSLSTARAKAVAKYLKKKGFKGTLTSKGHGLPDKHEYSSKARRATLVIKPAS